jgi:hypothetical protein
LPAPPNLNTIWPLVLCRRHGPPHSSYQDPGCGLVLQAYKRLRTLSDQTRLQEMASSAASKRRESLLQSDDAPETWPRCSRWILVTSWWWHGASTRSDPREKIVYIPKPEPVHARRSSSTLRYHHGSGILAKNEPGNQLLSRP